MGVYMKFKIGLIILCGTLITIFIYFHTDNKKVSFLSIGDGIATGMTPYHIEGYDFNDYLSEYLNEQNNLKKYYKNFSETDETITTLLTKLNNNITSLDSKIKIKQAIKESKLITIALGMDELNTYASKKLLSSSKINNFISKYEELLKNFRKLNKNKIIVISLYETNILKKNKITLINEELKKLCSKYKITFIDITDIKNNSDYFTNPKSYYVNYKGQKFIFEKIKGSFNSQDLLTI